MNTPALRQWARPIDLLGSPQFWYPQLHIWTLQMFSIAYKCSHFLVWIQGFSQLISCLVCQFYFPLFSGMNVCSRQLGLLVGAHAYLYNALPPTYQPWPASKSAGHMTSYILLLSLSVKFTWSLIKYDVSYFVLLLWTCLFIQISVA